MRHQHMGKRVDLGFRGCRGSWPREQRAWGTMGGVGVGERLRVGL